MPFLARAGSLGVVLFVAGCAPQLRDPLPPAPVYDAVSCTEDAYDVRSYSSSPRIEGEDYPAVMGSIPEGFVPIAAVQCTLEEWPVPPDDPVETERTMVELRLEGDMEALVRALNRPSWVSSQNCPDMEPWPTPPLLWLVDADGRAVVPEHPYGECRVPFGDVEAALSGLTVVDRTVHDLGTGLYSTAD